MLWGADLTRQARPTLQPKLLNFSVKGGVGNAQDPGRFGLVAAAFLQNTLHVLPLEALQQSVVLSQ